ncbi:MAG: thioesterase family protein [Solirubrobacterales bacterium]
MYKSATHRLRVRYNECDPLGVVFNANYLLYADIAINELWREHVGGYESMMESGLDLAVVEANLRYFKPLRFDEEVDLVSTVTHIGNKSMVTEVAMKLGDDEVATASLTHVCVTSDSTESRPVPESVRQALTI